MWRLDANDSRQSKKKPDAISATPPRSDSIVWVTSASSHAVAQPPINPVTTEITNRRLDAAKNAHKVEHGRRARRRCFFEHAFSPALSRREGIAPLLTGETFRGADSGQIVSRLRTAFATSRLRSTVDDLFAIFFWRESRRDSSLPIGGA